MPVQYLRYSINLMPLQCFAIELNRTVLDDGLNVNLTCLCQRSTITRKPGVYCGPTNNQRCTRYERWWLGIFIKSIYNLFPQYMWSIMILKQHYLHGLSNIQIIDLRTIKEIYRICPVAHTHTMQEAQKIQKGCIPKEFIFKLIPWVRVLRIRKPYDGSKKWCLEMTEISVVQAYHHYHIRKISTRNACHYHVLSLFV